MLAPFVGGGLIPGGGGFLPPPPLARARSILPARPTLAADRQLKTDFAETQNGYCLTVDVPGAPPAAACPFLLGTRKIKSAA